MTYSSLISLVLTPSHLTCLLFPNGQFLSSYFRSLSVSMTSECLRFGSCSSLITCHSSTNNKTTLITLPSPPSLFSHLLHLHPSTYSITFLLAKATFSCSTSSFLRTCYSIILYTQSPPFSTSPPLSFFVWMPFSEYRTLGSSLCLT